MNRDRISAAGGSYIRCFSNKGKEFFKFDTNSTEAIRGLGVEETYLWTAGVNNKIFHIYIDIKEIFIIYI